MEKKEVDTDFISVCGISNHFSDFLALSTQNIFFKFGMFLFLHVFRNLPSTFYFPRIPTCLVSCSKHPLPLPPSFSIKSWRKSNPSLWYCSHCRESFMWIFEKKKKKKKEKKYLDRIITENNLKKMSPVFLHDMFHSRNLSFSVSKDIFHLKSAHIFKKEWVFFQRIK